MANPTQEQKKAAIRLLDKLTSVVPYIDQIDLVSKAFRNWYERGKKAPRVHKKRTGAGPTG